MHGVLFATTSEIFPANHRGTGNGLTGAVGHVFGVLVRYFIVRTHPHELIRVHACAGTYHRVIRRPQYCRTCIHRWWTHHWRRWPCAVTAVRAAA